MTVVRQLQQHVLQIRAELTLDLGLQRFVPPVEDEGIVAFTRASVVWDAEHGPEHELQVADGQMVQPALVQHPDEAGMRFQRGQVGDLEVERLQSLGCNVDPERQDRGQFRREQIR